MSIDENYYRPTEVDLLIGDPSKAKNKLNWKPKYNLDTLIDDMIKSDLNIIKNEK
jgi:GDPmannose 4,6-dehydratase